MTKLPSASQIEREVAAKFGLPLIEYREAMEVFKRKAKIANSFINSLQAAGITIQEVKMDFDLGDYKPQKVDDDAFDVIVTKKQLVTANINYARITEDDRQSFNNGQLNENYGKERFEYELEIHTDPQGKYLGRKLWKRLYLDDTDKLKKLADSLFTCFQVEFRNKSELQAACEEVAGRDVLVRAWGWKPDGDDGRELQMHSIKPVEAAKAKTSITSEVSF